MAALIITRHFVIRHCACT